MKYILIFLFLFQVMTYGQEETPEKELTPEEALQEFTETLKISPPKSGYVEFPNGSGVDLPEGYVFYDAESGDKILQAWGNPPSNLGGEEAFQGLIFSNKYAVVGEDGVTVSVTTNTLGYISDEEADDYDYDEILSSLQEGAESVNPSRVEQGYPTVKIVNWAVAPSYEKSSKKLYFAKELEFGGDPEHTLNYDIHVLGRKGYVSLGFIASMKDLAFIEKERVTLLAAVNYKKGYRYSDYEDGDKVAEKDFGSLITGSNVVIAGGILALILRFKKFLIIGFIAVAAFVGKIFGKKDTA